MNPDNLDAVLAQIAKAYGENTIVRASDKLSVPRIPTGSLQLDYASGGGVPIGRWSHWYGNFGSGKTTAALRVAANAQKMGLKVALYNAEKRFNKEWAEKLGVDIDDLLIVEGNQIEQIGATMEALFSTVHVHILDSIAASVSTDELDAKVEDWQMAMGARVWGKVLKRANYHFDDTQNCVILLNQVRSNMKYGGGEDPPGGRVLNFTSSMNFKFRKASWLYYDKNGILSPDAPATKSGVTGDTEADGLEFQIKVDKNTVSTPERTARIRVFKDTGKIDELWDYARLGIALNIFERSGSWYSLNGTRVQGENGLREWIKDDEKLRDTIREAVLA